MSIQNSRRSEDGQVLYRCASCGAWKPINEIFPVDLGTCVCAESLGCMKELLVDRTIELHELRSRVQEVING